MKARVVIGVLLTVAALLGVWTWQSWNERTSAASPAVPVLTEQDKTFIRSAAAFLQSQAIADEEAATRGHFGAVRDFARGSAAEHRKDLLLLKQATLEGDPDFSFENNPGAQPLQNLTGGRFDRAYLNAVIHSHSQAMESTPAAPNSDSLGRFIALWKPNLERHLGTARQLLGGLPDTASSQTVLLLIGVLCLSAAHILRWKRAAL